ncbi:MAG: glycosyltransferase family 2 protein [Pseudomonadota bacterium]|nr:glycosyltransferase family 2 protein [Pseudomonadota bacterium]
MESLSIVIVNYKSWVPLARCLESIQKQENVSPKVIVVDNNSADGKFEDFRERYSFCTWLKNTENKGFAAACNQGAQIVESDWVLFLNPDTKLPDNCLLDLTQRVENISRSIVSIKQLNDDRRDTYSYGIFLNWYSVNGLFRFIYNFVNNTSKKKLAKKTWHSPDWVSGSFLMMRLADFNELGGWDESYWMYYEDMDLCKRASINSIKTIYYNDIFCFHSHGKSSRFNSEIKIMTKVQLMRSALLYVQKHYSGLYAVFLSWIKYISGIVPLFITSILSGEKRKILKKILSL